MDDPRRYITSRRIFLRNSTAALVVRSPVAALFDHRLGVLRTSPLKSAAQYASEASQFESAFADFSTLISSATDINRLTTTVDRAAKGIDYLDSWMIAIGMRDTGLVSWVKKTIRDEASLKRFAESVKRDPRSIYTVPEIAALSMQLDQLKLQKRAILTKLISQTKKIVGLEASSAEAAQSASDAQKCAKTSAMVVSVFVIVVVTVVAVISAVFSFSSVDAIASDLAAQYHGVGAEYVRSMFDAANQRYAQCVIAAKTLPIASQPKAIAACQVALLTDKIAFIG